MTGEERTSADARPQWVERRRLLLLGGAAGVVLALVAGLLVWMAAPDGGDSKASERNRVPFVEALSELAAAKGLHYKDTAMVGITERDVTVTESGTVFGSTGDGVESLDRDVLRIGGKTYTRWKKGRDYEAPDGKQKDPDAPGRWTVGSPGESYTLDPVMAQYLPPSDLAFKLWDALDQLDQQDQLPDPNDPDLPPLTVDGVPALRADTSAGRLVVAKNKPYRVLRLEPYDLRELIKDQRKQLEAGATPSVAPRVTTGPLKDGDSQGMELSPLVGEQADAMYDTLEKYAKQLNGAVDDGVDFTLDGAGKLNCGSGGCSVLQKFTGKLSTEAKARITGGTVTATMSATITIDGQPAGSCTVPSRVFPLTGSSVSGSLSCSAPEAGPVFAAIDAKYKAQAEQQSRASGGQRVTLRFYSRANTLIDARALAVGEVDRVVDQVGRERRGETCSAGTGTGTGTGTGSGTRTNAAAQTFPQLARRVPAAAERTGNCVNWSATSVKTFGHTFKTHGAGAKNTKSLTDRARSTGNQQGQWLDNDAAAEFLKKAHLEGAGPRSVRIPNGLGQVILPDGSIVPARAATIVPSPNGLYKTAYPVVGPD
ncbi:hypothetical protein ACH4U7_14005 [Streptomyces sp. NPDC020845]|uniref:hypothetical protein n=1 Tax=Streptomyces sp. NPDC020845 TaxID=3365096 RepID=UPI00379C099B